MSSDETRTLPHVYPVGSVRRIVSGLVSLLRPLIGGTVTGKLSKGVETVNRLSQLMRQHPHRVLFEAMDPPAFPDEDIAFLKQALENLSNSSGATQSRTTSP